MNLGKNTIANFLGSIIPLFIMLITVPVYLNLIGDERYGILAIIWIVFGYFGFFDLGLGRAIIQRMAKLKKSTNQERSNLFWTAILITFLLGIFGGAILWIFADQLIIYIGSEDKVISEEISGAIFWLFPALPILLINTVMIGALQGRERFIESNYIGVLGNIFIQTFPLLAATLGYKSLVYLIPAALLGRFLTSFFLYFQCIKHVKLIVPITIEIKEIKPLLSFGGLISIIGAVAPFLIFVDRLVIATLLGAKSVTYYTIPYNLSSSVLKIPGSLATALFPRYASVSSDARSLAQRSTQILSDIMTPLIIIAIVVFEPFLTLWLGFELSQKAENIGEILLLGIWMNSLAIPHVVRIQAEGNLKQLLFLYLVEIPIYFLILWICITYWGILGAAIAWTIRASLDSIAILWMSGELFSILHAKKLSLIAILITLYICITTDTFTIFHWIGMFSLFGVSLYIGKSSMILIYRKLFCVIS